MIVLTAAASQRVEPYRLDMALRIGAGRSVPAITFVGRTAPTLSRTGHELASRGGPSVLQSGADIAQLVVSITHAIEQDSGSRVEPLFKLMMSLRERIDEKDTVATILQRVHELTGVTIETTAPKTSRISSLDVVADGHIEVTLFTRLTGDRTEDQTRQLALQLAADSATRLLIETSRAQHLPMLSQGELLTELLSGRDADSEPLLRRARALGVPIDGWHVVARLDIENLLSAVSADEIAAYELRQELVKRFIGELRGGSGSWHHARSGQDLLFIHTDRRDPGPIAAHSVALVIDSALERVLGRSRYSLVVRCGVGGVHTGPHGLRASALESRASVAQARLRGVANRPLVFDATGVRRGLVEWYTSDAARESAKLLLAPLDQVDPRSRNTTIRTLTAYLDSNGSLARAGEELHIHRNAVAYRVKRALALLQVALDDPEQRLMLHLACRAELLSVGTHELG
jgi:sugar diacid utilization regulator